MTDIDVAGGEETLALLREAGGEGFFLRFDVRVESDAEEMVAKAVELYGRLDCAVNNAAVVRFAPIIEETTGELRPACRHQSARRLPRHEIRDPPDAEERRRLDRQLVLDRRQPDRQRHGKPSMRRPRAASTG